MSDEPPEPAAGPDLNDPEVLGADLQSALELRILAIVDRYGPVPVDETDRRSLDPLIRSGVGKLAFEHLTSGGLIFIKDGSPRMASVTWGGQQELIRRQGFPLREDVERLVDGVQTQVAAVEEAIERNRSEQTELTRLLSETADENRLLRTEAEEARQQFDRVREQLAANDKSQQDLRTNLEATRKQLEGAERSFYFQILPIFALAVSAFALVITSGRQLERLPTDIDAGRLMELSFAMLAPLAGLFLVLVLVTLLASWFLRR